MAAPSSNSTVVVNTSTIQLGPMGKGNSDKERSSSAVGHLSIPVRDERTSTPNCPTRACKTVWQLPPTLFGLASLVGGVVGFYFTGHWGFLVMGGGGAATGVAGCLTVGCVKEEATSLASRVQVHQKGEADAKKSKEDLEAQNKKWTGLEQQWKDSQKELTDKLGVNEAHCQKLSAEMHAQTEKFDVLQAEYTRLSEIFQSSIKSLSSLSVAEKGYAESLQKIEIGIKNRVQKIIERQSLLKAAHDGQQDEELVRALSELPKTINNLITDSQTKSRMEERMGKEKEAQAKYADYEEQIKARAATNQKLAEEIKALKDQLQTPTLKNLIRLPSGSSQAKKGEPLNKGTSASVSDTTDRKPHKHHHHDSDDDVEAGHHSAAATAVRKPIDTDDEDDDPAKKV